MQKFVIKNIKSIVGTLPMACSKLSGKDMAQLPILDDGYIVVDQGLIVEIGRMADMPELSIPAIEATDRYVMAAFCDSHTHLVYAGNREREWVDRIQGLSYAEIAARGGGILNSAKLLHQTSEDELLEMALPRLESIISTGTGAVEIKSGYGLSTEDELKMLRVIARLKKISPLTIKATFLAAHAVPSDYLGRQGEYVDLIINQMLPLVAEQRLADYIDVFCDTGFFTCDETERMLVAAAGYGIPGKIHANEMAISGGVQVAVRNNCLSADHLECMDDQAITAFQGAITMPTILPGAALFLGLDNPPARRMIEAGLPIAIASDYNPGSSPTGNMPLMMSLAAIRMKMLPLETIAAATINSAYAMGLERELGSVTVGKRANLVITRPMPSLEYLQYSFGENLIEKTILNGIL